jgi:hypothetical protein
MNEKLLLKAQIEEALEAAKSLISDFTPEGERQFRKHLYDAKQLKWKLCFMEQRKVSIEVLDDNQTEFKWFSNGIANSLIITDAPGATDEKKPNYHWVDPWSLE